MTAFLQTGKAYILGGIFIIIAHMLFSYSVTQWPQFVSSVGNSLPVLLGVSVLLSAYFKQARMSLLSLVICGYYILLETPHGLAANTLLLYGLASLAWLSLIAERGLLSLHLIKQLALLAMALGCAHLWLMVSANIQLRWPQFTAPIGDVYLPIALAFVIIIWRNISQPSLAQNAVLITATIWALSAVKLVTINWPVTIAILCGYYLLATLVQSYFLAYRDELTGLSSRRALYHYVNTLGNRYSVAMVDIDHFKKFNDTYGHDIGDQVLRLVASKIDKVRRSGKAFRYGGEEFSIVFSTKNSEQILAELERIRTLIAEYDIVIRQTNRDKGKASKSKSASTKKVNVTVSIGVAHHDKQESFDEALKRADQALYKAKKAGRNKVLAAT